MERLSPERLRQHLRAACCNPTLSGCRGCAGPIGKGKQFYCEDPDCKLVFEANHFYGTASRQALVLALLDEPDVPKCDGTDGSEWCYRHDTWAAHPPRPTAKRYRCARCLQPTGRPEVNHIVPLNGDRHHFGCQHHLENLEVLCHECHLATTRWQREAGLIRGGVATRRPDLSPVPFGPQPQASFLGATP